MIGSKQVFRSTKTKVRKNRDYEDEKSMKVKQKKHDKALLRNLRQEKNDISYDY